MIYFKKKNIILKKSPIDIFSQWVDEGKDDGMEKNHMLSVKSMLDFVSKDLEDFTFIDAGCGNGWVVRSLASLPNLYPSNGNRRGFKNDSKSQKIRS